jgi:hypothetical protein
MDQRVAQAQTDSTVGFRFVSCRSPIPFSFFFSSLCFFFLLQQIVTIRETQSLKSNQDRQEAQLRFKKETAQLDLERTKQEQAQQLTYYANLKELGVDLTAYLVAAEQKPSQYIKIDEPRASSSSSSSSSTSSSPKIHLHVTPNPSSALANSNLSSKV